MDCGEAGDPGGEEEGEEAREDRFSTVDDGGFGRGNMGLPLIHLDEGDNSAEEDESESDHDNSRITVTGNDVARALPGGDGNGGRDDGHGEEHHKGKVEWIVSGKFRTFEPKDLTSKEDCTEESFRFPAAEVKGARVKIGEDTDAEDHHDYGDEKAKAGKRSIAERDKDRHKDAEGLRDEGGGGSAGVTEAIRLKQDTATSEEA